MSNQPSPKGNDNISTVVGIVVVAIVVVGRGIMFLLPDVWASIPELLQSLWNLAAAALALLMLFAVTGTEPNCFVATAVYESKTHPDVLLFKRFRDETLLRTMLGRFIVQVYYLVGPYLAKLVILLGLKSFIYRQLSGLASWMRQRYKL